jgi:hypothetical protein
MKSLDIDDAFDAYMRAANPDVSWCSTQYRESRRCFMAGMYLMLEHTLHVASELPEDKAEVEIAQIEDQLVQFKERVEQDKD